jgi:hypothetical protein
VRFPIRSLMVVSLVFFYLICLLTTHVTLAFAVTKHGCVSPTPPVVAGPLYQPAATQGSLFINEVLLTPHSNWNCSELGVYTPTSDTWVELYNPQNQPLDLYAAHANIDSGPNTNSFYVPFGSAIAAHGYLTVFPRTASSFVATETSTWRLLIGSTPIDEVKLPALGEDQSYARIPDGGSTWQITSAPTIDATNSLPLATPTKTTRSSGGVGTGTGSGTGVGTGTGGTSAGGILPGQGGQLSGTGNLSQQVDGHQPSWNTLQSSTPVSVATPLSGGSTVTLSPTSSAPPTMDVPRRILLTILVLALTFALLWCWRVFHHPSQKPADMISSTETGESKGIT